MQSDHPGGVGQGVNSSNGVAARNGSGAGQPGAHNPSTGQVALPVNNPNTESDVTKQVMMVCMPNVSH